MGRAHRNHRFQPIPYGDRSRRERRNAWVKLRWKITQAARRGGPHGYLDRHVEEPDKPLEYLQWADVHVLGSDGRTVWNMALITVRRHAWDRVAEAARNDVSARMTPEEHALEAEALDLDAMFERIPRAESPGKGVYYRLRERPLVVHASLNGRSVTQAQHERERELMSEGLAPVHEHWTLHHDYAFGVGVHAVVAADGLTRGTMEAFVERFMAWERSHQGRPPRSFEASEAADPAWLPTRTERDTFSAMEAFLGSSKPIDLG